MTVLRTWNGHHRTNVSALSTTRRDWLACHCILQWLPTRMTHFGKCTNFTKTPTCKSMKNCNQSYDLNFTNKPWHKFRSITVTVVFCQQRIGDISIQCGTLYRRWAAESFVNTIILHLCLHLTHIVTCTSIDSWR